MYCPACGKALPRRMNYCSQCGAQLTLEKHTETEKSQKRFDDYVDGIFWITVFGLGLILGGIALMKQVLNLSQGLIVAFMIISSTAFLTVFAICLWQIIAIARGSKKANENAGEEQFDTNRLAEGKPQKSLEEPQSVIEDTTRTLNPILKENAPR
jgi:hypothetical protein